LSGASPGALRYTGPVKLVLEHVGLAARNPILLKDWYSRVLEARILFDNGAQPPAFMLVLPGGQLLELYPAAHARPETNDNSLAGWRHLALCVDSIDAARAELSRRGVQFTESPKPAGWGGRVLFFADPEGNLLHLVERPADSPVVLRER
jgi:glyoxylase I family protein